MRSEDDDPLEGVRWYAWWRVEGEFEGGGEPRMVQLSKAIGKAQLSQLRRAQKGGAKVWLKLAPALGMTPGSFWDAALTWWERGRGKEIRAEELERRAAEARRKMKSPGHRSPKAAAS